MKRALLLAFSLMIVIIFIDNVLAITGSIGNARMILRLETGEEIEKYVLVKNVNDVPLNIELTVSGDLKDYVNLKDTQFRLEAGEEKKAYFTIVAAEQGTTETKINVAFTPEEGSGVGLSSAVIVIAQGESKRDLLEWFRKSDSETDEPAADDENKDKETITGAFSGINISAGDFSNISTISLGLLSTTAILAILVVLLVIYAGKKNRNKNKKRVRKSE